MTTERVAPERTLVFTVAAVAGLALVATVFMAFTSSSFAFKKGCAYDGESYCAMARGHEGHLPFNRRVLLPGVVRLMHVGSLPGRFRLVDFVALGFGAWLTALLTRRLARAFGVEARAATAGGVLAGALLVLSPETARIAIWNPVGADNGALALGLAWLVLATSPSPSRRWWAVPAAAAAILAREAWLLPIVAGAALSLRLPSPSRRQVGAQLAVAAAAAVFAFTRPGLPLTPNIGRMMHLLIGIHFQSGARGYADLTWALLFLVGLIPLLFVRRSRSTLPKSDNRQALVLVVAVVAIVHLAQAVVGSTTTSRAALPVLPLLLALAVSSGLRMRHRAALLALAALGTVLVWQPFHILDSTARGYFAFCCPQFSGGAGSRLASTLLVVLPIAVAMGVLSLAPGDYSDDPHHVGVAE